MGVFLAVGGGLAIDAFAPQLAEDYGMTAAVIAGAMTVPVSLLLAVYLIDYSQAHQRASAWQEFWAPVQESRLRAGSYSLSLVADQLLPSRVQPRQGEVLVEVTDVRRWLPTIRAGVDSGIHQLTRFAETAEHAGLFVALERLTDEHERYQSLITKFSSDIDEARERGDLEDGTTAYVFSPLSSVGRESDHRVIIHETESLRETVRNVLDLCDSIEGRPHRPRQPMVNS